MARPFDLSKTPVLVALISILTLPIILITAKSLLPTTFIRDKTQTQVQTPPFTIPILPSGFEWRDVPQSLQKINRLKWVNAASGEFGVIPLTGKEWVVYKSINSVDEEYSTGIYDAFIAGFISNNGWHKTFSGISQFDGYTDLNFDGNEILGNILSPTITNYTFTQIIDDQILVVNYYESVDEKFRIKHPSSVDYIYPHEREFRIFIGDIISIDNLLNSRIKTTNWLDS